ncbi:hypothetical protein D3C76_1831080 [compost metagenome]
MAETASAGANRRIFAAACGMRETSDVRRFQYTASNEGFLFAAVRYREENAEA